MNYMDILTEIRRKPLKGVSEHEERDLANRIWHKIELLVGGGAWEDNAVDPTEMWAEIQKIREIIGDDGTHGAPSNLVQKMKDDLQTFLADHGVPSDEVMKRRFTL